MNGMEGLAFLDAAPFRAILESRLEELKEREWILDPHSQLAVEIGMSDRATRRVLNGESERVSFDNADRIVTRILGPMEWYENEELSRIYSSVDLTSLDWSFPVSETVRETLMETAVRFVKELGTSAHAAQALGVSISTVGRYAREARAT